ncbi:MAG: phage major capsid protein [Betaproteobacteria bacterium]|nr:phage major capsid protein [Betaproteobacteria bacterium]
MNRAYSLFTVKNIDEDRRIIEGIATTPTTDRMGDVVDPEGAQFALPLPLLWMHNSREPVGHVISAKVSPEGISITAQLAKLADPGKLKDRLDEAWHSLKIGLVRGLSIGFTAIESAQIKDSWSEHFIKWEWLELSCVTIPANAEANIISVKSADQALLAASGERQRPVVRLKSSPGASGTISQRNPMKTIAEQIAAFEAKRAASAARMNEIMAASAEKGETLEEAATQEYDGLKAEIKQIDEHLVRLKEHEAAMVAKATQIVAVDDPKSASAVRGGAGIISVRENVEKGVAFTRYVKALAMARGNLPGALAIAQNNKRWLDTTPQVIEVLKAAVAGGDTTTSGWASQLVYQQNLAGEFIELLRPLTIIGKLSGLTRVPFNVRMSGQDSGSTAYWVGQGKPVPVSKGNYLEVTLGIAKAAGLVVLTEELVRSSEPSAELLMRNDLTKAIATFLDVQFVDPTYAEVTNISPASITNGVTPVTPTGTASANLRADVQTLFGTWIDANLDPTGGVWIMSPTRALAISLMLNALGQPVFPTITMQGGFFFGLPVVVSNSANIAGSPASGDMIILVNAPEVLLADDGQVTIDASREASIEMLDNPTNDAAAGTPTSMVSMFQTNSVAIKAVRFINWKKRRTTAVVFIRDGAYVS